MLTTLSVGAVEGWPIRTTCPIAAPTSQVWFAMGCFLFFFHPRVDGGFHSLPLSNSRHAHASHRLHQLARALDRLLGRGRRQEVPAPVAVVVVAVGSEQMLAPLT